MNDLPKIETPEEAKELLTNSHVSFIDSAAKFLTLADYYSTSENVDRPLPATFQEDYQKNYQMLLKASEKDFLYALGKYAALSMDYLSDVKENLEDFASVMKGQDPSLSDYDKASDLLAIRDSFTDEERELNQTNKYIAINKELESHVGDQNYDPQLNQPFFEGK